ncbi:MAG: hypothetical protein KME21_31450 [Desmonostoc vinosum HA7617-LM4]|nr:hypothetical protein [Desmonostoc vinosum HA7617-LM4]
MSNKIAVAVIHGIGKASPEFKNKDNPEKFAGGIARKLKSQVSELLGEDEQQIDSKLEIEAIYWAPILQDLEDELSRRLELKKLSNPWGLRDFIIHSLADSIGYQITPKHREIYDQVHEVIAETLKELAQKAGRKAPLCIIGHSLGSVITSNYIWDLQNEVMQIQVGNTPLEQGETLALYYTLGSQIALWRLRYTDFGTPITIPSPKLSNHYPNLEGEWVNFYDRDDVLGFPVKAINDKYKAAVKEDVEVNSGNILTNWTPFSHNGYWTDDEVTKPIAMALASMWKSINPT